MQILCQEKLPHVVDILQGTHLQICPSVHTKATPCLGCSQPVTEHGRMLDPRPYLRCGPPTAAVLSLGLCSSLVETLSEVSFSSPLLLPSLCPCPDARPAPCPEGSPGGLVFPLSFKSIFPNKFFVHLILSCCLLLGGPGLVIAIIL